MSEHKGQRGRPKGSGIDDRTRLQTIAAMIAANPELKPTTAIKSIGINDPSIIRRLRDKFHAAQTELMAELHGTAKAASAEVSPRAASHAAPAETYSAPQRAMAVQSAGAGQEISIRERFRSRRGYRCTHRLCPAGSCRAGRRCVPVASHDLRFRPDGCEHCDGGSHDLRAAARPHAAGGAGPASARCSQRAGDGLVPATVAVSAGPPLTYDFIANLPDQGPSLPSACPFFYFGFPNQASKVN